MGDSDSCDGIDWDEQERLALEIVATRTCSTKPCNPQVDIGINPGRRCAGQEGTRDAGFAVDHGKSPIRGESRHHKACSYGGKSPGGRKYGRSPSKGKGGAMWVVSNLAPPKKPLDRCPGVYGHCGGELTSSMDEMGGCWYCVNWPSCKFRIKFGPQVNTPILSLEIISFQRFKITPANGASSAVSAHGGLMSVLQKAGVDLMSHVPILPQEKLSEDSAKSLGEEFGEEAVFFRLDDYIPIEGALNQHGRSLLNRGSLVLRPVLRHLRNPLALLDSEEEVERRYGMMWGGLQDVLMPFQRAGVRFGLERGGRCLIADEMGVGKTLQAIALATCYQDEWPLLIVAPASLRLVWAEELEKWLSGIRPSDIHVIESKMDAFRENAPIPKITIISFEMLRRLSCGPCCKGAPFKSMNTKCKEPCKGTEQCIGGRGFRMVIVDESHNLRTTKSRQHDAGITEATVSAVKRAKRAVLLTGTPSLSKPFDLYRQVDALRPGILTSDKNLFADRYCDRKAVQFHDNLFKTFDISGASHCEELHLLLSQVLMIRRLKKNVLSELPPKRRQVVRLPRPAFSDWPPKSGVKRKRNAACESETDESGEDEFEDDSSTSMGIEQRTGLAKLPSVMDWLRDAIGVSKDDREPHNQDISIEENPKFLVFAHHRTVMAELAVELDEMLGCDGYVRVDGECDPTERMLAVRDFKCNPKVRLALLSVTAAGVGLDFSSASAVVFVELPKEVSLVKQAEDRAHRKGQSNSVNVYFLCAKGTMDDSRWQNLGRTLENISLVHDGKQRGEETARTKWGSGAPILTQGLNGAGIHIDEVVELGNRSGLEPEHVRGQNGNKETNTGSIVGQRVNCDVGTDVRGTGSAAPRNHLPRNAPRGSSKADTSDFWFEVSKHTSRVHVHCGEGGDSPLGISFPIESLLVEASPPLEELKKRIIEIEPGSGKTIEFVGPFGLVRINAGLVPGESNDWITAMIACCQEFGREWNEIRSVYKNKLHGKVLMLPLDAAIEEVSSEGPKFNTNRYFDIERVRLPEGVSLRSVQVYFADEINPRTQKQPVRLNPLTQLCMHCFAALQVPQDRMGNGVLPNRGALFCSGGCHNAYRMKTGQGCMRRELFRHERGVCQMCGVNCHELVRRLRNIRVHSKGWRMKRESIVKANAPKIAGHGYKKLYDRLVSQALDGYAWHADHIIPVYRGGGQCGIENLRTLCVACHADVTKQQAQERKAERDKEMLRSADPLVLDPVVNQCEPSTRTEPSLPKPRPKKQRPKLKRLYGPRPGIDTAITAPGTKHTVMGVSTPLTSSKRLDPTTPNRAGNTKVLPPNQTIYSIGSCDDLTSPKLLAFIRRRQRSPLVSRNLTKGIDPGQPNSIFSEAMLKVARMEESLSPDNPQ